MVAFMTAKAMKFNRHMNNWSDLNMNQKYLIYHTPIPRKGIYISSVKLLLVLSIHVVIS